MKIKKDINIKLSSLEGKIPSDVLSAKEFSKLLPFLPANIALNSISGQYWTTKMINEYGSFYREPMKTLNDNQKYIVFCWILGCSLWEENPITWETQVKQMYLRFGRKDWEEADNVILYFATSGAF